MNETTQTLLAKARELDAQDKLAHHRNAFVDAPGVKAYLDGNSLGRPLKATAERMQSFIAHDWGTRLIRSWDEQWMELPGQLGDRIGKLTLGAAPGQTIVADSTSIGIYKLVDAAAGFQQPKGRTQIVIEEGNFPTDRFIVEGIASARGMDIVWLKPDPIMGVQATEVAAAVSDKTALVLLSHVDFRSGALADMQGITKVVKQSGALMIWDLCHSAGCVPMQLDEWGVDLAVGCTYKYLNGGPGSPAFIYVAKERIKDLTQPIWGWWGAANVFEMGPEYESDEGIKKFLSGTAHVTSMIGTSCMLDLIEEAGIETMREKSRTLTELAIEAYEVLLAPLGAKLLTPQEHADRGSHISVGHEKFNTVIDDLWADGVIPDFRNPDNIRLGLSPLSTSHEEVIIGMAALAAAIS